VEQSNTLKWSPIIILALLIFLSGCASKIPSSLPLAEGEKPLILNQLQEFQNRRCAQSLDADVTLEWQMYGKTEKIPSVLQLQSPSFLRYSVVDPIGRQLLILVSDGSSFTLVDNRKAKALTGQVESNFWNKYIPEFITSKDYISWLTGRLPEDVFEVYEIRQDKESVEFVWLLTKWKNNTRHHVLFSLKGNQVIRHIVESDDNETLLDVVYSDYDPSTPHCTKPNQLKIEGAKITGTLKLHFDEFFPENPISPNIFHLTLPDHFSVKIVE
jgi:outer membrane lipoprotein-sorting protein